VLHVQAEAEAATLRRAAVRDLLSMERMSQADAAAILGLSYQRVQQLAKTE
jgi:predicted XRE-type DNA-binding protein